jgi:cystathionine beta-lyase/cystathionine gamma-synthase
VFPVVGLALPPEKFNPLIPMNLVRVYIGLEDCDELLSDLLQALDLV